MAKTCLSVGSGQQYNALLPCQCIINQTANLWSNRWIIHLGHEMINSLMKFCTQWTNRSIAWFGVILGWIFDILKIPFCLDKKRDRWHFVPYNICRPLRISWRVRVRVRVRVRDTVSTNEAFVECWKKGVSGSRPWIPHNTQIHEYKI